MYRKKIKLAFQSLASECTVHYALLAAWLSGRALVSIKKVTLRRARLVGLLEWVTVCGRVYHLALSPATQVNSAFYP